ncbi:MAG: 3-methyl-2-oxobutanoate hydroxymethyltransferase [Ancrocorticia sp.]|nr:3-methyl-2-oxobutanoate hydroxymethyltransferase [Ancrocorticia sp.]
MSGSNRPQRVRLHHLTQMKERSEPITMLTCYDAVTAQIFDNAAIDMLLVGDSFGNTLLGYGSTIKVTLDEMLMATGAVSRGAHRAFVVADLPFGTYEESPTQAVSSAVQLEGGVRQASTIKAITDAGIPVIGHIGFTPQSEHRLGGPRVQGRGEEAAAAVIDDAVAVQEAGASGVVLEMVPARVSGKITKILEIPTIGIGAGDHCDGQVLVWTDMAGMTGWSPSFSKQFGTVGAALRDAATSYSEAVKSRAFPDESHSF